MKTKFSGPFRCAWPRAVIVLVAALASVPLRADAVFAWNELLLQLTTTSAGRTAANLDARTFAMVHLAMRDALASFESSAGSSPTDIGGQRAAVAGAAHAVLVRLMPANAPAIEALYTRHVTAIPEGDSRRRGLDAGRRAAGRLLAQRQDDRWEDVTYSSAAFSAPDSAEAAIGLAARGKELPRSPWLRAVPFRLKSCQQFTVRELQNATRGGEMVVDRDLRDSRLFEPFERTDGLNEARQFWSSHPIVIWNRIARQLTLGRSTALMDNAKLLAALNVALADATLSSVHWRHVVGSWRVLRGEVWHAVGPMPPEPTDVLAQISPLGETELVRRELQHVLIPPTPNFPSMTATVAGAAQAALADYFRTDAVEFTLPLNPARNRDQLGDGAARSFGSISAAARECAFVASLNGHQSREACIAGYWLGTSIGNYIGRRVSAGR